MTIVNNNYYRFSVTAEDTFFNIPVEISFDMAGRNDGIVEFEKDILPKKIAIGKNYRVIMDNNFFSFLQKLFLSLSLL